MNIKDKISSSGFKQWQVAEVMGISEFTLCRYLRKPEKINDARLAHIEKALKTLNTANKETR